MIPSRGYFTLLIVIQIGYTHGERSREEIERGIAFYSVLFLEKSGLSWSQVQDLAKDFDNVIHSKWPRIYQELQGNTVFTHSIPVIHE